MDEGQQRPETFWSPDMYERPLHQPVDTPLNWQADTGIADRQLRFAAPHDVSLRALLLIGLFAMAAVMIPVFACWQYAAAFESGLQSVSPHDLLYAFRGSS
jgi:hypothetical protein